MKLITVLCLLLFFIPSAIANESFEIVLTPNPAHPSVDTIRCLEVFKGSLYAGTSPNGLIYRSSDGITWNDITDMSASAIKDMVVYEDILYACTDESVMYYTEDGVSWSSVLTGFPHGLYTLYVYDGYLYAGQVMYHKIMRTKVNNGVFSWDTMSESTTTWGAITVFKEFNGCFYAGGTQSRELFRSTDGITWTEGANLYENRVFGLEVFKDHIYAGTSANGYIWRSSDGIAWVLAENPSQTSIQTLISFNDCLYAGTGQDGYLYRSNDGLDWHIINDTSQTQVYCTKEFKGSLYVGTTGTGLIYRNIPVLEIFYPNTNLTTSMHYSTSTDPIYHSIITDKIFEDDLTSIVISEEIITTDNVLKDPKIIYRRMLSFIWVIVLVFIFIIIVKMFKKVLL